ncbi:MAG: ribbon-helix-helix domain-containing protein [Candidatus Nanohaloarchaea archaeon]|nr:ribbon-helix-helix domain-containing protein [Candidatus Nanohaloarchaea archaeon]
MTEYTTISIPKDLHEDVDDFIDDTNFTSVAEFTKHILRDTISGGDIAGGSDLSEDEVEKVRDRLRNLGYLE